MVIFGKRLENTEECKNYIETPECEFAISAKHMQIEYRNESHKFYAKDNGSDSGTFYKIERPIKLKQGYVLAFGESSMAITTLELNKLSVKFLGGSREDQSLYFSF